MSDVRCDAIDYPMPFLEARLLARDLADDAAEAAQLAGEVKRFLVLSAVEPEGWPMWSYRVDAAWHELLLFTDAYARFCHACFGRVLAHEPAAPATVSGASGGPGASGAPGAPGAPFAASPSGTLAGGFTAADIAAAPPRSLEDFAAAYRARFGRALPSLWDDAAAVRGDRRLRNPCAGATRVRPAEGDRVELLGADGQVRVRVGSPASAALRFVAARRTFHPRELPELAALDAVALCATLVRLHVLEPCW